MEAEATRLRNYIFHAYHDSQAGFPRNSLPGWSASRDDSAPWNHLFHSAEPNVDLSTPGDFLVLHPYEIASYANRDFGNNVSHINPRATMLEESEFFGFGHAGVYPPDANHLSQQNVEAGAMAFQAQNSVISSNVHHQMYQVTPSTVPRSANHQGTVPVTFVPKPGIYTVPGQNGNLHRAWANGANGASAVVDTNAVSNDSLFDPGSTNARLDDELSTSQLQDAATAPSGQFACSTCPSRFKSSAALVYVSRSVCKRSRTLTRFQKTSWEP